MTGKTYFGGLMEVEEFWDNAAMMGFERYGLGPLTRVFGGGDGANWIGPSFEEFQSSLFMLCRYHWKRDIFRRFPEGEGKDLVRYVESKDKDRVCVFFEENLNACGSDNSKKEKIQDLKKYLLNQWDYIQNYRKFKEEISSIDPALSRIGVIEGHIYQVLHLRFESRGGYWSDDGLNALLHVLMAELNGNLAQFLSLSGHVTEQLFYEIRVGKHEASVYILVNWNFDHIVRTKTIIGVGEINRRLGLPEILICSTEEVVEYEEGA